MHWKKGRGKLGPFQPLLGSWHTKGQSERGPFSCLRRFEKVLDGKFIQLTVTWQFESSSYQEICLIGSVKPQPIQFWSFTSDGKHSKGWLADVLDLHEDAIGFEADMPAGRARQAYWPHPEEGMVWVVESQTKKGWNRFVEHHYKPTPL